MKLIEDRDNWIVKLSGQDDLPRQLALSETELKLIRDASELCSRIELFMKYEDMNEFGWAVIYLNQILELYAEEL
jgi:hypothetical protein